MMKSNVIAKFSRVNTQDRRVRILLALSALTMFVLSAGAPGATGW